jgi:hypothetical protein
MATWMTAFSSLTFLVRPSAPFQLLLWSPNDVFEGFFGFILAEKFFIIQLGDGLRFFRLI